LEGSLEEVFEAEAAEFAGQIGDGLTLFLAWRCAEQGGSGRWASQHP